jgi:hypothetical protein
MHNLPLKIGKLHPVIINDPDPSNPCRRKIKSDRRAQSSGSDQQDRRVTQPDLPRSTDFRKKDMARISLDLLFSKLHGRTSFLIYLIYGI